jgi:hypothetical protein
MAAVNSSAISAVELWQPTVDGVFLKCTLREAFEKGLYTKAGVNICRESIETEVSFLK